MFWCQNYILQVFHLGKRKTLQIGGNRSLDGNHTKIGFELFNISSIFVLVDSTVVFHLFCFRTMFSVDFLPIKAKHLGDAKSN